VAGAVLVFSAIVGGSWWYAVSGAGRHAVAVVELPSAPTSTVPVPTLVPRVLDGVLVPPEEASLPAYAVMIDNQADARPQSALSRASVVFEVPVEGGLTRYMAIFDATSTASEVGPVRSARPYFVEIADGVNAVYSHVGGSDEALNLAKVLPGFKDINEFYNGGTFWRSNRRSAPHNVYTSIASLRSLAEKKAWAAPAEAAWKFLVADATSTVPAKPKEAVVDYPAVPTIRWTFDSEIHGYRRALEKTPQKDADGTEVLAANVLVLGTDGKAIDDYGRLKIRTTGSGKLTLYRDGDVLSGVWRRAQGEPFRFETDGGTDLRLRPGPIWIQIVTASPAPDAAP
jgi:hypothetical protein